MSPSDLLGGLRAPRLRVIANDSILTGAIEAEIVSNNHFAADRFAVSLALDADPGNGPGFWSSEADVSIDVQVSLDGGASFASLIQGAVDTVDLDMMTRIARISGRDYAAALIETRTQETFSNRTSSEIAELFALRHGLRRQVTPTTTPVGRYYQDEHDRITLDQFSRAISEWDLLVFLARQEGFDLFVSGATLCFQPRARSDIAVSLQLTDLMDLRLERSLTLARDIEVTVKSWNARQQNAFTQTARALGRGGAGGKPQRYIIVRPNLTSDQALQLAQQSLAELTRHERVVIATMPGELGITPRTMIALTGTGTDFDQIYYADEIERTVRFQGGFVQRLRAKNASPASETTTPADIVAAVTN